MRTTEQQLLHPALIAAFLAVALAGHSAAEPPGAPAPDAKQGDPPNIVFILVDDARAIELEYGFGRSIPSWESALQSELIDQGTMFENFFNSTPLCCPSRANYLTGRYSHNNGVYSNNYHMSGGNGGWRRFWELGHEQQNIGKWLQDAGYQTVLIGKFLNQYPNIPGGFVPENYVPEGWDEWFGTYTNDDPFSYYEFRFNENGEIVQYGDAGDAYLTDVERDHAVDYIERAAAAGEPFFLYLNPFAPHAPIQAAPRHEGMHADAGLMIPNPPAFGEEDLSDKPRYVQLSAREFPSFWGPGWNLKLDMTLTVDELVRAVVDTLSSTGLLDNTYIFFTSDNGSVYGEHSVSGKTAPYEEIVRMPLIVRGPGVPAGETRSHLALNLDLPATLLELASAEIPAIVDGESLVELMLTGTTKEPWRESVLLEYRQTLDPVPGDPAGVNAEPGEDVSGSYTPAPRLFADEAFTSPVPAYFALRTPGYVYVEYETDETELYDLVVDPYQLESKHATAPPDLLSALQTPLQALSTCAGGDCATAARIEAPNALPLAVFTATCDDQTLECTFDSTGSFDVDGEIVSFSWDFGDGSGASGAVVSHQYGEFRGYFVTLTVEDDDGGQRIATKQVFHEIFQDGFESGDASAWSSTLP